MNTGFLWFRGARGNGRDRNEGVPYPRARCIKSDPREGAMRRCLIIALCGVAACGGGSSTEPPPAADVSGTWNATVSNMTGGAISCRSTGATQLTLTQTRNTFSGLYSGGQLTCSGPRGTSSAPVLSGSVRDGAVDGNNVRFDIDTPDSRFTGTVSGTSMSGTARWRIDFGPPNGVVTLDGNWEATMQ